MLYEYTFNREAVLSVFDLPSGDWHVYALHLAIVHMHDIELVDKVTCFICSCSFRLNSSRGVDYAAYVQHSA